MKLKQCLLMASVSCSFVSATYAQPLDTLRRKDPDGWEFIQVKRGANITIAEGYRHNGVDEGAWITYWDNGYPRSIYTYRKGKRNGVHTEINQQGYTELVENYKDDLLEGPQRRYQLGTSFITEEIYYSEGKKHGRLNKRYSNGNPQEEANYNMDKRDGKTIWYYDSGEKAAEYNYRDGNIDGEVSAYYKNGKVSEYGLYKDNQQTGDWKEFWENGNLKAEGKYVNGEKSGSWKEYNEQGKFVKTVRYDKGKKQ